LPCQEALRCQPTISSTTATTLALNRELNRIRRNALTGKSLFKNLTELYHRHNMREWLDRQSVEADGQPIPRIVCSEGLE
jgi:hypothetical protein